MRANKWYKSGSYAKIKDLNVFYKQEGCGAHLVCIHGFPSSSWDFEAIWPTLIKRFNVLCYDLIGLGKSSKPNKAISVSFQADALENLLVKLGVTEAHILTHDLGNTIAQELLARQDAGKSNIQWLTCTFLNGGLFPETHKPLLIQKLLISPIGLLVAQLMTESSFRKNMVKIFSEDHPPSEDFISSTWQLIVSDNGKQMIPRIIRYMQERINHRERWVTPLIKHTIPHQLINGVDDPISGELLVRRYEELIPNATVVRIKKSGHYPHLETPSAVLDALLSFIKVNN